MNFRPFFLNFIFIFMASEAMSQSAFEYLEKDLISQLKTLKKDIQIYHYFKAPTEPGSDPKLPSKIHSSLEIKDSRDLWVNYLLSVRAGAFWDLNNHSTDFINAGPGMYFAIDPNSSSDYGDTAVVIKVQRGINFLSVTKPLLLKKETLNMLLNENIISKAQLNLNANSLSLNAGFTRIALKNMVRPENEKFRKLIIEIFNRNNISFIEYVYQSHLAGFCKISSQSAFVFIGQAPELNSNQNEVLAKIESTYQNALLFSNYKLKEENENESTLLNLLNRFRNVLAEIRQEGTNAAKKIITNTLSESEINELASVSYECTRRF